MKISIITPSFNQGIFIERTINSVLTQNIPNLEYFVIDNQSQDETISILNQYSNYLHYVSEQDRGQAHAVNKGLQIASGEIIGWLNSDDVYYPNALIKVIKYFTVHPAVDVVYGSANHIDENDKIIAPYPTEPWNFERLKKTCYLSQPAVFFRRRILSQLGLLDETLQYCMDYEYWLRLALSNLHFVYLPEVLAGSRFYPTTKTCSDPIKATFEAINMLKKSIGYVPSTWLVNYAVLRRKHAIAEQGSLKIRSLPILWALTCYYAFKWNGLLKGLQSCINLPLSRLSTHGSHK